MLGLGLGLSDGLCLGLGAWCGPNGLVHGMGLMVWVRESNGLGA